MTVVPCHSLTVLTNPALKRRLFQPLEKWIMERKRSSRFHRIFTIVFPLFLSPIKGYCENTTKPTSSFSFHEPFFIIDCDLDLHVSLPLFRYIIKTLIWKIVDFYNCFIARYLKKVLVHVLILDVIFCLLYFALYNNIILMLSLYYTT